MPTTRSFANMLNSRPVGSKPLSEDDMSQLPEGGLKLPKMNVSTYSGMLASTDPTVSVGGSSKKEKKYAF